MVPASGHIVAVTGARRRECTRQDESHSGGGRLNESEYNDGLWEACGDSTPSDKRGWSTSVDNMATTEGDRQVSSSVSAVSV